MTTLALRCKNIEIRTWVGAFTLFATVSAAAVDLSNTPMTTSTATSVRPNLMFVLDDSGSMASDYMPDWVRQGFCRDSSGPNNKTCAVSDPPYMSSGFNGIYYNPINSYRPPANADGTSFPDQFYLSGVTKKWDKVQKDPYLNPTSLQNVETNFPDILWCKNSPPPIADRTDPSKCRKNGVAYATSPVISAGYNYPDGTYDKGVANNGGPYYYTTSVLQWCKNKTTGPCQPRQDPIYKWAALPGYPTGTGTMQRFEITAANCTPTCPSGRTYADEMTNFANWYAYYRTRINMAKTGVGRAFVGIDDNYRAGLMTIHTSASDTSDYIPIQTFNLAQKNVWFAQLYSIDPGPSTPLRTALATAGRMYAGKILTDPVQYSCQKNYTILSTDGYWNGGTGFDINGGAIGNQDNTETPPKFDGNTSGTAGSSAGGSETLADVAMYYYKTDLRDSSRSNCVGALGAGTDVCKNNVAPGKKDTASHQHMTTFTIGLGVDGENEFRPDYETASTGTYAAIKNGSKNWPAAQENMPSAIDDLWHAAVNGSGTYYSAKNPQALTDGLGDALRDIGARSGAAAAASTSNPQVTTKDNFVFSSNYRTSFWDSIVKRQRISVSTGELLSTIDWEAGSILNTMVSTSSDVRTIYLFSGVTANKLRSFDWSTLTMAEKAHLDPALWADPATKLPQWPTLSADGQTAAKAPGALVKFLRGQTDLQDDTGSTDKPFRGRENVLGDIVNAETEYIKQAQFEYEDPGYSAFKATTKNRQGTLFAASNDGMLHAFNADTGREMWAYIPSMVIPKLYKLAVKNYLHEFFVDGSPVVGDVFDGSNWRSILVGSLNKGGQGYYALDVTDPTNPKALWEFCNDSALCSQSDSRIGFTYGNPIIAKLSNGEWTVMVTSGYNNADGKGYLFALNPITGAQKFPAIATSCTGANCGLSKISPWITSYKNQTAERVYGGDLDGNMWRFDINNNIAPAGREAHLVARLGDSGSGLVQSITTKPELTLVGTKAIVLIGTGRFLGDSDKTDSSINSFYAFEDDLSTTGLGNVRVTGVLEKQVLTEGVSTGGQNIRTNSNKAVDWSVKKGWYLDFPSPRERNFTDASLVLGTVAFTTNIPTTADPCSGGGVSWLYQLDFRTGGAINTAKKSNTGELIAGQYLANEYATRPVPVQLPSGKVRLLTQINDGKITNSQSNLLMQFLGRRAGWREIID
jgi:type IV pilus assembly protein PilY1